MTHRRDETTWPQARQIAYDTAELSSIAELAIPDSIGATTAEPILALVDLPPADISAMDGYAVAGDGPWLAKGTLHAGQGKATFSLAAGEAAEIATGAVVPVGATAVLPYEFAAALDGVIRDTGGGTRRHTRRHIRRRGCEVTRGTPVILPGTVVTPVIAGLAASVGYDRLRVRPRARVSLLVTGNELIGEGIPRDGRTRDALGPMLPGLIEHLGGRVIEHLAVSDDADALRTALTAARGDIVVTTGATSMGRQDYLLAALAGLGAQLRITGVACRPGHPQILATMPGSVVVGLPGNPLAAVAAAYTILAPLLDGMAGRRMARGAQVKLVDGTIGDQQRTRLVPVVRDGTGARPTGRDRAAMLWGLADADALAVVPPGWAGGTVQAFSLPR